MSLLDIGIGMLNNYFHIARIRQGVTERMMYSKAWSQTQVEDVELVGAKGLTFIQYLNALITRAAVNV